RDSVSTGNAFGSVMVVEVPFRALTGSPSSTRILERRGIAWRRRLRLGVLAVRRRGTLLLRWLCEWRQRDGFRPRREVERLGEVACPAVARRHRRQPPAPLDHPQDRAVLKRTCVLDTRGRERSADHTWDAKAEP